MAKDKEERIKALKQQLAFVNISLVNAQNHLKAGKVVAAATIDELMVAKKGLEEKISRIESGEEDTAQKDSGQAGMTGRDEKAEASDEIGIPSHLRIKRFYTLSPAAMEQRKHAAKQKKPGNKIAQKGNKNGWKHGKFAKGYIASFIKPCKSTCPDYPCEIIVQGGTKPGEMCLDRAAVIQGYQAITDAMKDKPQREDFNDLAALTLSKTIQTIHMLLDDISRDGTMAKKMKHDKEGVEIGYEIVPHPSFLALPKLLQGLGLTPSELMLTPKSLANKDSDDKGAKSIADLMSGLVASHQRKHSSPDDEE